MRSWRLLVVVMLIGVGVGVASCARRAPQPPPLPPETAAVAKPTPQRMTFTATAYAVSGETASGKRTRRGIVAADPKVIPLGSRIRVHEAGAYSGEYEVADTGAKVDGRIIDIYMPSPAEARKFGRRKVQVEIIDRPSK